MMAQLQFVALQYSSFPKYHYYAFHDSKFFLDKLANLAK